MMNQKAFIIHIKFRVAESDEDHRPTRIAGAIGENFSVAEGDEQALFRLLLGFSERTRYSDPDPAMLAGL